MVSLAPTGRQTLPERPRAANSRAVLGLSPTAQALGSVLHVNCVPTATHRPQTQ